ncbi:MAG: sensor domain-containing diguanylate cyclase [Planctomycetes bacterium]|nr:sensor domain-containing diguanylate cyclase [Planctomycetota bacterium]
MKRAFLIPVAVVATALAAGDAAVVWYFKGLREKEQEAETQRVRSSVAGHLLRHVEGVRLFARQTEGEDAERHRMRAEALSAVFPALVGTAHAGTDGKTIASAAIGGFPAGTADMAAGSPAYRAALSGSVAVDDPHPAPNGDSVVAVWVPSQGGAVAGVFRMDRLMEEAMDAATGRGSPFVLRDSRGREVVSRGDAAGATLEVPIGLPGLSWTVRSRDPERARDRTVALLWSIVVLSAALWAGFTLARHRAVRDLEALGQRAHKLAELADVERRERGRLITLLDSLDDGVVLAGPDGKWLTSNMAGIRLLGATPAFVRADGSPYPAEELALARATANGVKLSQEDCWLRKDGTLIPLSIVAAPLVDEEKRVTGAVGIYRDVSRQRAWEELVRSRDFAMTAKTRLSAELEEAKSEEEMVKRLTAQLENVLQPLGVHVFLRKPGSGRLRAERASTGSKSPLEAEAPVVADNSICPVMESGEPLDPRQSKDRVQPCLGRISPGGVMCAPLLIGEKIEGTVHLELTTTDPDPERVELAFELIREAAGSIGSRRFLEVQQQAARRDPLTGLFNRRHFDEVSRIMMVQAKRYHHPLAVLMLDIDHFKLFNDRHGHDAGDVVLREFAISLMKTARQSDVMVRYGGEEFAVLLPETGLPQARIAAERILESTRAIRLPIPGLEHGQVTVSIGVAAFPEHGDSPEAVVKAADRALYSAKGSGRNRVVTANESGVPGTA